MTQDKTMPDSSKLARRHQKAILDLLVSVSEGQNADFARGVHSFYRVLDEAGLLSAPVQQSGDVVERAIDAMAKVDSDDVGSSLDREEYRPYAKAAVASVLATESSVNDYAGGGVEKARPESSPAPVMGGAAGLYPVDATPPTTSQVSNQTPSGYLQPVAPHCIIHGVQGQCLECYERWVKPFRKPQQEPEFARATIDSKDNGLTASEGAKQPDLRAPSGQPVDCTKLYDRIVEAEAHLSKLCETGGRSWSLSIPVRQYDSDMVYGDMIRYAKQLLALLRKQGG